MLFYLISFLFIPTHLSATSRFYSQQYLVAGESLRGDEDGPFDKARFREPAGLALATVGGKRVLFALDREACTLRLIQIEDGEAVSTVLGNHSPGHTLLPASACLNQPESLQTSPSGALLIEDRGNNRWLAYDPETAKLSLVKKLEPNADAYTRPWVDPRSGRIFYGRRAKNTLESVAFGGGPSDLSQTVGVSFTPNAWVMPWGSAFLAVNGDTGNLGRLAAAAVVSPSPEAPLLFTSLQQAWPAGVRPVFAVENGTPDLIGWDPASYSVAMLNEAIEVKSVNTLDPDGVLLARMAGGRARALLQASGWAAWDNDTATLYLSDTKALRVVAMRPFYFRNNRTEDVNPQNSFGLRDVDYPEKVPPNTRRLVVVSDSQGYASQQGGGPQQLGLSKQLETELNFRASLESTGGRYEVFTGGASMTTFSGGLIGRLFALETIVKTHGVKEVLMLYTPHLFFWDAIAFTRVPLDEEGLPPHIIDPEFLLDKKTSPANSTATAKLHAWYAGVTQTGNPWGLGPGLIVHNERNLGALVGSNEFLAVGVPVLAEEWMAMGRWAKARGLHVTIVKVLDRNAFGSSETESAPFFLSDGLVEDHFSEGLQKAAEAAGLGWIDLGPEERVLEPAIYPFYLDADWHWTPRAHRWIARLLGDALWKIWAAPTVNAKP